MTLFVSAYSLLLIQQSVTVFGRQFKHPKIAFCRTGLVSVINPFSYAFGPALIGDSNMYTLVLCWGVVNCILGAISSVVGTALRMDW